MPLYFAYGSNMSTKQLRERGLRPKRSFIAELRGHKLEFNKQGSDGSGKVNVERDGSSKVLGVVFEITQSDLAELDRYEGAPAHYGRKTVTVVSEEGESCSAITYIALRKAEGLRPTAAYVRKIIEGAVEAGLPWTYIEPLHILLSSLE